MKKHTRTLLRFVQPIAALGAALILTGPAWAQDFPDKPVTLVVGYNPGGGVDISARLVAAVLSREWGQPVVVQNTPGAGGNVAADAVAQAPADGYTLLYGTANLTVPGDVALNFDISTSFTPIRVVAFSPSFLLVNSEVPVASFDDLISYARANPDVLTFGNAGVKTRANLEFEQMAAATDIIVTGVTYKGAAEAVTALLGNEIQLLRQSVASSAEQVKAGSLRALTISGQVPATDFPDVPTYASIVASHPELAGTEQSSSWYALLAPAGTPDAVVQKIGAGITAALADPSVQGGFATQGLVVPQADESDLRKLIQDDIAKWQAAGNSGG